MAEYPAGPHCRNVWTIIRRGLLTEQEIVLTDAEVEAILGAPLPTSAYTGSVYWTDARLVHVQRWSALGWRARRDRRNTCVFFTRDAQHVTP